MATPFTTIFDRAIFRFTDYDFLKQDIETREDILEKYLYSAKTEFQDICKYDLSKYDVALKQFDEDLDDETIEILSLGISYYWLSYKSLNSEAIKNVLNSRDYYYYSPSALLKEVQLLRTTLKNEFHSRIRSYSYRNNEISSLKP